MYHQTIEMMRFLTPPLLNELRRRIPLVSTVANKQLPLTCLLPPHHSAPLNRPLYTGATLRKDVPLPQTKEDQTEEKLDLDIWKSVMRFQVPAMEEEKQGGEEGGGGAAPSGPGGGVAGQEEVSPLEATRELVVMWRQAGKLVPEIMTDEELGILAEFQTKSSKKKYLKYLAIKEGHKNNHKQKQEKKKAERSERFLEDDRIRPGGVRGEEGELRNTFLLQFWGRSLDKLLGWRSAQAVVFGQPLVFDMSYEQQMTRREVENTVSQLMEVEGWNRRAPDPFHLHFCNLQPDGGYHRELVKRYGAEAWERLLITSTEQRHVDLFPRDDLVYLTADSPNVLRTFDNSKVYIVGSMVDRSIQSGLSLANAKRLKLNTARLPLDDFLQWETGAKNLTLDQMIRILLTLKESGRWEEALEHVPKRKHDGFYQDRDSDKDRRFSGRTRGDTGFRAGDRDCDRTFRSGDRERSFSRRDSVLKRGDSDRAIRTGDRGDSDRAIRTGYRGDSDRAVRTGDSDRAIRTGDSDRAIRTGDSDRAVRTGDRVDSDRAIRTGDRGDSDRAIRTGDRDGMEEWRQKQMNGVVRERGSTSRHKDSVFSSRDTVAVSKEAAGDAENRQNTQTTTRVRTSLKTKMEDRNSTAKSGKKLQEEE
ncbi:tRNA methyltransferase 10 homolog C-like isoform X2 [Oncorhynchus kisutch]|uniref:tRNA methyltransferase 10 homolog C-like isoform X2 n=1 Tax=Oncorhynchus kisutch TaxID=8019 RepID=UPI0012DCFDFA|nr:tRNA methyltransferase 10 homolog C-like isoform X2 [Oncorhynchus kisutch]